MPTSALCAQLEATTWADEKQALKNFASTVYKQQVTMLAVRPEMPNTCCARSAEGFSKSLTCKACPENQYAPLSTILLFSDSAWLPFNKVSFSTTRGYCALNPQVAFQDWQ